MKNLTLSAIFLLSGVVTFGQNLIGFNYEEIQKYMSVNHKDMSSEKVTNNLFNYLKYSDRGDSETILFFLNPDSVCKSIRVICNLSVRAEKVKEFNSIYRRTAENIWIDTHDGKDYLVEIRDEQWSSIINIEPYK
jgi:hypothetical protein